MKLAKILIPLIVTTLTTCLAHCGSYIWPVPTLPGGGGISGSGTSTPFTYNTSTGYVEATGSGYPASIYGSIQYNFVWTGPEDAPKSVIVRYWGSVDSQGYPVNVATASNGLGSPSNAVLSNPFFGGQHSEGYKYAVVPNPGSSFSVTITPSASGMTISGKFSVSVTPVTISVSGAILDGSTLKALMGQYQVASIDTGGYAIDVAPLTSLPLVSWIIPQLDVFKSESWGTSSLNSDGELVKAGHHYIDHLSSDFSGVTAVGYYVARPKTQDLSASATIRFPDNTTGSVEAKRSVSVVAPPFSFSLDSNGTSQYDANPYPTWMRSGSPSSLSARGARFKYLVNTVEPFYTQEGNSQTFLSQLIQPSNTWYTSVPSTLTSSNANYVLDNVLFYDSPEAPYNASSTLHCTQYQTDTPALGIISTGSPRTIEVVANSNFLMSAIYLPVDSGAGGSAYVPLSTVMWDWSCTGQESSTIGTWLTPSGNPSFVWQDNYRRDCYEWDDVATNVP